MYRLSVLFVCCVACIAVSAQEPVRTGNPLDPLNPYFTAQTPNSVTPYSEFQTDAGLNDICFVNSGTGWAVGDHGTVWKTSDGEHWQKLNTPVDCPLRSVSFLDENYGAVVGGYCFPGTDSGRGVVLTTRDGGKTWSLYSSPELPSLYKVKVFDSAKITVAGESSEFAPSGILTTNNAGKTWKPLDGNQTQGWQALDFYDTKTGLGIDLTGKALRLQKPIEYSLSSGTNRLTAVKAVTATGTSEPGNDITGWAVGESGLILSTADGGLRWTAAPELLPVKNAELIDLKTVEVRGQKLWVAGNPGTVIFHSPDGGKTWKNLPTGFSGTLRKIVFTDDRHGYAAGTFGTILKTSDGGNTWTKQRSGGEKLAMLGVFGTAEDIPPEIFAAFCANKGYLGGCLLAFRNTRSGENFHEALCRIGCNVTGEVSKFPILPKEVLTAPKQLSDYIQRRTDNRGMLQFRERLTVFIRQYKPEIMIVPNNMCRDKSSAAVNDVILREVAEAVKAAQDPAIYPFHQTELGLACWQVKKLFIPLQNGTLGDVKIQTTEPVMRFASSLDEMSFVSRRILRTEENPSVLGFAELLNNRRSAGSDFFSGIEIVPGSPARRNFGSHYIEQQPEAQGRIQNRRNVLGILQNSARIAGERGLRLSEVGQINTAADMSRKLDAESAVQILLNLGDEFYKTGDWLSAIEVYEMIAQQYPQHPLCRSVFSRLIELYASDEIAHTLQLDSKKLLEKALDIEKKLEQQFPDLADKIENRFAAASAKRRLSWQRDADVFYQKRSQKRYNDVWSLRADAELPEKELENEELQANNPAKHLPVMLCRAINKKPYLDGHFDKDKDGGVWMQSKLYRAGDSKTPQLGTLLMLLHDNEYLYLALRCPKVTGFDYPAIADKQRERDVPLNDADRVEILLDTDRDYSVYYSLTVDSRGWVNDSCNNDKHWNPLWHVARFEDNDAWYIEAAVPFASLVQVPPKRGEFWGISVRRLVPGREIETWERNGSGLLRFE